MTSGDLPLLGPDGRFGVASAGGTFHGFHSGHREYLELALRLSVTTHIFLTDDNYAAERKDYQVEPLADRRQAISDFAKSVREVGVFIQAVSSPAEVDDFFKTQKLDLAVVIPEHVRRFSRLSQARVEAGLPGIFLLVKPRTRIDGRDISARDLAAPPPRVGHD